MKQVCDTFYLQYLSKVRLPRKFTPISLRSLLQEGYTPGFTIPPKLIFPTLSPRPLPTRIRFVSLVVDFSKSSSFLDDPVTFENRHRPGICSSLTQDPDSIVVKKFTNNLLLYLVLPRSLRSFLLLNVSEYSLRFLKTEVELLISPGNFSYHRTHLDLDPHSFSTIV